MGSLALAGEEMRLWGLSGAKGIAFLTDPRLGTG